MTSDSFLQLLDALPTRESRESLAATFSEEVRSDRGRMRQALEQPDGEFSLSDSQLGRNYDLNRYSDMLPYNHNRVRLAGKHDYINASHIALPAHITANRYIATQGPLPHSIGDFWRMVWEQRVPAIVMLARTCEAGRRKCEPYWPPAAGATLDAGDIAVLLQSELPLDDHPEVVVRRIELRHAAHPGLPRAVTQLHFVGWPDERVPDSPLPVLRLIRELRGSVAPPADAPVVVHCSAGVGRTGTFIVIDAAMDCLARAPDYPGDLVAHAFRSLRTQRTTMVQTLVQYQLCYQTIAFAVSSRK
ncbi:tyrosine protein phosphatase 1 [Coemansia nantahalensis]|uniref:Tyrosine protein phosphatase 1 n=1 Tax=Coemansia nantahalensis TaxID=2789366 RepID=A0ACC1JJR7_9FUNG|nr:tyrosine protein phosphatase 1 [Coemansia nantahalensis]